MGNAATQQTNIGELVAAERNLRRSIEICREIKDEIWEAVGHRELGHVLACRGEFTEVDKELATEFRLFEKQKHVQGNGVTWAYRALRALLMGDAPAALSAAHKTRDFAEEWERTTHRNEYDFIRAEWLISAALIFALVKGGGRGEGSMAEAERHLPQALARDRKIGLVEVEAAILLEFVNLRFAVASPQSSVDRQNQLMRESFDFANEAREIAERCEYRLQQAEIHNFSAEWHVQQGSKGAEACPERSRREQGRKESLKKAREHAERAKERAWCDGPPYHYKVAYEQAERMPAQLDQVTRGQ